MSRIEDYLGDLHQGVWEVVIPKELITDSLGADWKRSPLNVPTPGTIASYRNGQYHVHETQDEWKVHLDRYDPKVHPLLHLIDDAPLMLMIFETMMTLYSDVRGRSNMIEERMNDQLAFLKNNILGGAFLIFLGLTFILSPELDYYSLFQVIIPLVVIGFGLVSLGKSIIGVIHHRTRLRDILTGGGIVLLGLILSDFSMDFWNSILLTVLCVWMMLSAILLLNRIRRGKAAVLEGFYSRLAIAVISLTLAIGILFIPAAVLTIFMFCAGMIVILMGCTLIGITLRLRERAQIDPYELIP